MPNPLREYRCKTCKKLLCKGQLKNKDCTIEVKCRGCGMICTFSGLDAEIITERSMLIRRGLIPDPEKETE